MGVQKKEKEWLRIRWKRMLNYQNIVKQIPFFLFLTVLAVLYIYNGHFADKAVREISRTERELKELKHEYKTVKGEVLFRSKQSELAKAVEPLGLKEMSVAPMVLVDSTAPENHNP
ncbi:FtsL-like putative cell division protein [Paraflavisolibacter sp. H34]|uniref:FtsL-like putative cell division protein n=1 Tax=Huijunlia imazamoxiresistens TaxID=3127457 RepID=UPI00301A369C